MAEDSTRLQPLSCVSCRKRKVKCPHIAAVMCAPCIQSNNNKLRYWPCEPCTRQGITCEFPSRRRARQTRSQPRNNELIGRLARLEEILGKVDPTALSVAKQAKKTSSGTSAEPHTGVQETKLQPDPVVGVRHELNVTSTPPATTSSGASPTPDAEDPSGATGKYLSSEFWMNLCTEVDGIKQTLEQSSDEEEDDDSGHGLTPDSAGQRQGSITSSNAQSPPFTALIGSPSAASGASTSLRHPSPDQIRTLCTIYFANVELCFKVLHRPTVTRYMYAFASSPTDHLTPATEVLFFAIYFAAVSTLTDESCLSQLREERSVLVSRYKAAFEVALARADHLNSTELEPLQAFVIYICLLRTHKESKAAWALTALAVRLARGLGLHKDGDGSRFSPYIAESRRRLWWSIFVLDIRGVEDRGTEEPLITFGSYDIVPSANVNDDDFGPETTAPLVDRAGPTDATFSLCTAMSSRTTSKLMQRILSPERFSAVHSGVTSEQEFEKDIFKSVQALESTFVVTADPSHLGSVLASAVARIVVLRVWLMLAYPFQHVRAGTPRPPASRQNLLRTALSMLELEDSAKNIPESDRWLWWITTYPQWHCLAVALAELCKQTEGPLPDRAWSLIDRRFTYWGEVIADTSSGTLWRPIRKLYKKAKAARMEAQMSKLGIQSTASPSNVSTMTGTTLPTMDLQFGQMRTQAPVDLTGLDTNMASDQAWSAYPDLMLQDPGNWLAGDLAQNFMDITQDPMDWSNWNEFVTDSFAGERAPSSDGYGGGVL